MSLNSTIKYNTSQQNNSFQNSPLISPYFTNTELVTTENNIRLVNEFNRITALLFETMYNMAASGYSLYMSHDWLAGRLRCTRRWVIKVLRRLKNLGLITWVSGKKNYSTNNYYIHASLLTNEGIRRLRTKFLGASLAWMRKMWASGNIDKHREFTPLRSKDLKSYRINRISIVEVIREETMIDDTTKKTGRMMNEEKKAVFEALKKRGLDFNDAAMAELTMFSDASLLTAGARFVIAAKKSSIANPWAYYVTIAKQVSDEGGISLDRVYASQIRTKMNIQDRDKRTLEYTPMMSDNNREDSKKRESGSGVVTQSTPDSDGWVYGVMPDGTKVRSRGYQNDFRKHARDPVDLPLVEKNDTKRSYGNPGETPQTIRMNMMNYVKSQAYTDNCQRDGKEYTDSQITLWMNVANLEEAGNFEKAEQIRAELYGNVMPKIVRI